MLLNSAMSIRSEIISSNYLDGCCEIKCDYTLLATSFRTVSSSRDSFVVPFYNHSLDISINLARYVAQVDIFNSFESPVHIYYNMAIVKCDGTKVTFMNSIIIPGKLEEYLHEGNKLHFRLKIQLFNIEVSEVHRGMLKLYHSIDKLPSDFTITTYDGSLKVTKNILIIKWNYFRTLMNARCAEYSTNVWSVKDFSYCVMKDLVGYIYCDAITFKDQDHVTNLLKAGHRYMLDTLVASCSKYLVAELNTSNVLPMLVLSDTYDLGELLDKSLRLMTKALEYKPMWQMKGYEEYRKYSNHTKLTEECLEQAVKQIVSLKTGVRKQLL
ncbi:hypothetical protein HDE_08814 [Halotydeus destructor]|nr:hypothetical protein HDE_08814 [Halotydeus destructor]